MELVFIDIDNTLLDFDEYIRRTMREGFAHFGLKPYEPYMEEIFRRENGKLWRQIEQGTLTFAELERIRWNNVFAALDIDFDGTVFETYFRAALYDSAIPVPGAMELLEALHGKYPLAVASNGPYDQQLHRLELAGMKRYFDWFFISERLGASKPAAAFFDGAFAQLNEGRAAPLPPEELEIPAQACRELRDTVSSLRLDNVLAAGFSLSRGRAAEAVEKGAVQVNWTVCQKPDKPVAAGDTITCRGLGKCVLDSVGSPTKKGRLPVVIRRFV